MLTQRMSKVNFASTTSRSSRDRSAPLLRVVVLMLALFISACEPESPQLAQPAPAQPRQDDSPRAWIEFPREGQTLPMGPVPFVVYASDPQNVVQIDLRVNGQALPAGQPRGLDAAGGYRLARLDQTWQPPAEGEYIVEARARNAAGAYGAPTYVKFCIGSCKPSTPTPTAALTRTPTPSPSITPTPATVTGVPPTITPTATPTRTPVTAVAPPPPPPTTAVPPAQASINFRSDAPYVNGGSCTTLRWDVDNVLAVSLDGQGVIGHGSKQVCPCQQTTYTLSVVKRDNTTENRQVTIMVYGSCAPPPAPPTTARPPTTERPPTPAPPPTWTPAPPPTRTPAPPPTPTTIKW